MWIHNKICNLLYHWTERRIWKSKPKSPGSFQIYLALKKTSMSSNKDFLPSSTLISSICAIEFEAIFSFSWWTVTSLHSKNVLQLSYWKSSVRGTSRHIVYFRYKKRWHSAYPGRVVLGLPLPSSRVCTDGRTLTSEPKFFGSTGYQICLHMVLRELR